MVYAQPRNRPINETHKILRNFEIQTNHLIPAKWPDVMIVNKKKRTCWIVDLAVNPAYHSAKLKESEKKDKYLELAREKLNLFW